MRYDAYRKQGLPLTSSLMESVVKQVNQRVKGTEKFWSEEGAEAILQVLRRPPQRRSTATGLLAAAPGGGDRATPLPPHRMITNRVVHPPRQRIAVAAAELADAGCSVFVKALEHAGGVGVNGCFGKERT